MYIYICAYVYTYIHMDLHIYIYTCLHINTYIRVCVYTSTSICINIYIYIYIYMFFHSFGRGPYSALPAPAQAPRARLVRHRRQGLHVGTSGSRGIVDLKEWRMGVSTWTLKPEVRQWPKAFKQRSKGRHVTTFRYLDPWGTQIFQKPLFKDCL